MALNPQSATNNEFRVVDSQGRFLGQKLKSLDGHFNPARGIVFTFVHPGMQGKEVKLGLPVVKKGEYVQIDGRTWIAADIDHSSVNFKVTVGAGRKAFEMLAMEWVVEKIASEAKAKLCPIELSGIIEKSLSENSYQKIYEKAIKLLYSYPTTEEDV